MKVALIHYHLRTGGVTRVLKAQSEALTRAKVEHLILSADDEPDYPSASIPELDYTTSSSLKPVELYQALLTACEKDFGSPPDLWHIHNATLGKSILFPGLIELIAASQTPLILQLHDFAEDNRPANYPALVGERIYPVAPQIHYAFINSRDRNSLEAAGLPPHQSHLLPNAVQVEEASALPNTPSNTPSSGPGSLRTVLYPIRAIRRKNIGEVILLAALAPTNTRFAISLAPENKEWLKTYLRWEEFSTQHQLPVLFDVVNKVAPAEGEANDFEAWKQHATHFITTSIAEGFGLTFLEPSAIHKPLFGRNIPEITCDFDQEGIALDSLYSSIPIPLAELDQEKLRTQLSRELSSHYQRYQQPFSEQLAEEAWQHLTAENVVDFGSLPESFQEEVILRALSHPTDFPLRDWLAEILEKTTPTTAPADLSHYSPERCQSRLLTLYQEAVNAPRHEPTYLSKERVLLQYLSPQRFHFLRS